jgi:hypothetical protein
MTNFRFLSIPAGTSHQKSRSAGEGAETEGKKEMNTKNLIVLAIVTAVASAANAQKGAHMTTIGSFLPAATKPVMTKPVTASPSLTIKHVTAKPAKAKPALTIKHPKPIVVEPDLKTSINPRPLKIKGK